MTIFCGQQPERLRTEGYTLRHPPGRFLIATKSEKVTKLDLQHKHFGPSADNINKITKELLTLQQGTKRSYSHMKYVSLENRLKRGGEMLKTTPKIRPEDCDSWAQFFTFLLACLPMHNIIPIEHPSTGIMAPPKSTQPILTCCTSLERGENSRSKGMRHVPVQ